MPIRAELREFYGPAWRRDRALLIKLLGPFCQMCGRETFRYLNAAHIDHDPRTSPVKLWCASCHATHDAPHSYAVRRRTAAKRAGQLWLLPEIEHAPFAAWMTGVGKARPAQTELFA